MEILLKKDGSSKKDSLNINELSRELKLSSLVSRLIVLEDFIISLQNTPLIEEKDALNLISKHAWNMGDHINFTSAPSIEKNEKVKPGVVYYNKTKGVFRGKTLNGWITLKGDK